MKSFKEHLKERGLTEDIYCWICHKEELVYFPIFNLTGELIGYQKYNWKCEKIRDNYGRYYTYISKKYRPDKRTPPMAFWGMEYFKNCKENDTLFLTEGVWDAVRVVQAGYNGIALLCNDPNSQFKGYFRLISSHLNTVVLLDQGDAGKKMICMGKRAVSLPVHDFNSFSVDGAKEFLERIVNA